MSRPVSTSTSALPHGHSRIKSDKPNSPPHVRQRAARLHVEVEAGAGGDRALGGQPEAELHRVGNHGAQRADLDPDAVHATTGGVLAHRIDHTPGDRHLVHVCPLAGR